MKTQEEEREELEIERNKPRYSSKYLDQKGVVSMFAHSAATLETLSKELLEKAGHKFARNEDTVANYLRSELVPYLENKARLNRYAQE